MKERPIIFSAPMVRAILDGTKTQTRRIVNHCTSLCGNIVWDMNRCKYGQPGDRIYVKEAYRMLAVHDHVPPREVSSGPVWMEAQNEVPFHPSKFGKVRPSIFMTRWASRITLDVVNVRVERLQDISEADAMAEGAITSASAKVIAARRNVMASPDVIGVDGKVHQSAQHAYKSLWDSINAKRAPWASNPWVWVVEFRRVAP